MTIDVDISFSPGGENRACVNVSVNEDQVIENTENFTLLVERIGPGAMAQVLDQSEVFILDTSGKWSTSILVN